MSAAERRPSGLRSRLLGGQADVLAVISVGGVLGSLARWGVAVAVPRSTSASFPLGTLTVNLVGCLAMGGLMVAVLEVAPPSRYLRPFLGTGVLGGFTTFSTYALDLVNLVETGHPVVAATYLFSSLFGGLAAVWLGAELVRRLVRGASADDVGRPDPSLDPPERLA